MIADEDGALWSCRKMTGTFGVNGILVSYYQIQMSIGIDFRDYRIPVGWNQGFG